MTMYFDIQVASPISFQFCASFSIYNLPLQFSICLSVFHIWPSVPTSFKILFHLMHPLFLSDSIHQLLRQPLFNLPIIYPSTSSVNHISPLLLHILVFCAKVRSSLLSITSFQFPSISLFYSLIRDDLRQAVTYARKTNVPRHSAQALISLTLCILDFGFPMWIYIIITRTTPWES